MSFRVRLTSFFVLIVVVPMLAVGVLVFRLIDDSQGGKADARLSGAATEVLSVYGSARATAEADAVAVAQRIASAPRSVLAERTLRLATVAGLARVGLRVRGRAVLDRGARDALAPGTARLQRADTGTVDVTVSEVTAPQLVRQLSAPGIVLVVRQRGRLLASSLTGALPAKLPRDGTVSIAGRGYRTITESLTGWGRSALQLSVLSSLAATSGSTTGSRLVAVALILGFLLLALAFAMLSSRGLQAQLRDFLQAARRLAKGDFSSPIRTEGRDEFAELGHAFNEMSSQLEARVEELERERRRLRQSLRRIAQLFAANLDRAALLDLALQTGVDAVEASCGRLSARAAAEEPLSETARIGTLEGFEAMIVEAERTALGDGGLSELCRDDLTVAALPLCPQEPGARVHAVLSVARRGDPFTEDDRELLRSLAKQATVALENVRLHDRVSQQAVTDGLTGLANHARFQDLLGTEVEQVRRYGHPLSLVLLDIDNFKSVNDTYGHQQGDLVLKYVARAVRDTSRDADVPARYGGEEMALILPHTDLEGAFAIAERARTAVESLRVPLIEGDGELQVTASLGVATMTEGEKETLVGEADAALYEAKRSGKNRTIRAAARTAGALPAG